MGLKMVHRLPRILLKPPGASFDAATRGLRYDPGRFPRACDGLAPSDSGENSLGAVLNVGLTCGATGDGAMVALV